MLWLVDGDKSLQITGCNTFQKGEMHQLWVEKPNGKTLMIRQDEDKEEIDTIKEAIDHAIEIGETTLRLV